jgi:kinesin family protein 3/17
MSKAQANTETVKVMVRVRPMNSKEKATGCQTCIRVHKQINQIELFNPENPDVPNKDFAFDAVYDTDA